MALLKVLAILDATVLLIYAIGAFFVFPEFEMLFQGLGTELPLLTWLVMKTYRYWLVLPLLPTVIYLGLLTKSNLKEWHQNTILISLVALALFSLVLLPLLIYAMYLPVFELDTVSIETPT